MFGLHYFNKDNMTDLDKPKFPLRQTGLAPGEQASKDEYYRHEVASGAAEMYKSTVDAMHRAGIIAAPKLEAAATGYTKAYVDALRYLDENTQ